MQANCTWNVFVVEYGCSRQPWTSLVCDTDGDGMVDLPLSFILARQGDRNVLIDTGFIQEGDKSEFELKFRVARWISPLRMLGEMGIEPEQISDIILTHTHFDHMGSISRFEQARIFIQREELLACYEAIAMPRRFSYLSAIVDPADVRSILEASIEHRVVMLHGDQDDVLPGIGVRLGPGHTRGHQFVTIETSFGKRVVSGDCIYTLRQLSGLTKGGDYVPLSNATGCVWDQLRTIDKLNAAIGGDVDKLVIVRDVERWQQFPIVKEVEGFRIVKVI